LQGKLGPGKVTLLGGILIGAGMILTSLITAGAPWLVYITYGIIAGLGVGAVYTSTIAATQKWFTDRRGFASGMIIGAFGLSLVVFAPLAKAMLDSTLGVSGTFLIFGISFLAAIAICSIFIQSPPEGYMPGGTAVVQAANQNQQFSAGEMIKTKQYYLLVFGLFFTLPAYFILNPVFISLGSDRGLTPELAVLGVALTGVSSAAGRITVAWISDKIGRKAAMVAIAVIILCASLVMIIGGGVLFIICIMLISFGFGGAAGVYSAMTAQSFGAKNVGMNFGLVMIGFAGSALLFPIISKQLTAGGSYTSSFVMAAVTCAVAIVLVLLMQDTGKSVKKK